MEGKVEELKKRIEDESPLEGEEDFTQSNDTLMRFLKSRDGNLDEAEKMIRATIEYRRQTQPLKADCKWCHEKPGFHSMRQVGFDEIGRPVIYSCFSQAASNRNSVEDSVAHVTYLIENAKVTMKPGISTWVFVIDCSGMTLSSCNPKLGYGVTQVMSNHYPERLGIVICLNHNPIFHSVWQAIKIFLHKNTVAKMNFVRSKAKIQQVFNQHFSKELTDWLLEEIKLNKVSRLSETQRKFWSKTSNKSCHDPRGSPSYVKEYVDQFLISRETECKTLHKPHPNIIDCLTGDIDGATSDKGEQSKSSEATSDEPEVSDSDSDDENTAIEILDEYQIPKDAVRQLSIS